MTQFERMMAELSYHSDDEIRSVMMNTRKLLFEFNSTPPEKAEKKQELLKKILGKTGERFYIEPPFRCDYGCNVEIGEDFYANYNLTILDCNKVVFGKNTLICNTKLNHEFLLFVMSN